MIDFVCDGCHTQLKIDDDSAGKLGRCPHCGTNTRVPAYPRRTPKWKMTFRMAIVPFLVVAFWGLMFCIADPGLGFCFFVGGAAAILGRYRVLLGVHGTSSRSCRTRGITDSGKRVAAIPSLIPWTDRSIPTQTPTRYQELYREKTRQESERCSAFVLLRLLIRQEGLMTTTSFEVPIWELENGLLDYPRRDRACLVAESG